MDDMKSPQAHININVPDSNGYHPLQTQVVSDGHLETWTSLNTVWKINYTSTGNIYYGNEKKIWMYERIRNIPFPLSQNYKTSSERRKKITSLVPTRKWQHEKIYPFLIQDIKND